MDMEGSPGTFVSFYLKLPRTGPRTPKRAFGTPGDGVPRLRGGEAAQIAEAEATESRRGPGWSTVMFRMKKTPVY